MWALCKLFWEMCLLRVGPERVPAAGALLLLVVVLDLLVEVGWLSVVGTHSLFYTFLSVAGIWFVGQTLIFLLLKFKNFSARLVPTLIAWNGTDILLSCIVILFQLLFLVPSLHTSLISFLALFLNLILVWSALVKGFIFSRALSVSLFQGTALAIAFNVLMLWLSRMLLSI